MTRWGFSAVLLLPALAGCAAFDVRTESYTHHTYSTADAASAIADGRELRVVVLDGRAGGSFPARPASLAEAAVAGLTEGAMFPARFSAAPRDPHPSYRVMLLFNGVPTTQASELCGETGRFVGATTDNGPLRLLGALCYDDAIRTEVIGTAGAVTAADDPRLRQLMRQTTRDLFPSRDAEIHQQPE